MATEYSLKFFLTTCLYAAQRARSMTREREGSYELMELTDKLLHGEDDKSLVMGGLYRALAIFDHQEFPEVGMFTSIFTVLQHTELTKFSYGTRRSFVGSLEAYAKAPAEIPSLIDLLRIPWTDTAKKGDLSVSTEPHVG